MNENEVRERITSWLRTVVMTGALLGGMLVGFHSHIQTHALAETPSEAYETVSGTLHSMNMTEKKGVITTDLGKQVTFQITKPELFINLSVGQRVTLKLDKQSNAMRVMDNAAPEMPPPSSIK